MHSSVVCFGHSEKYDASRILPTDLHVLFLCIYFCGLWEKCFWVKEMFVPQVANKKKKN